MQCCTVDSMLCMRSKNHDNQQELSSAYRYFNISYIISEHFSYDGMNEFFDL